MNPFADILERNLPRLLNLYQLNPVSPALGIGDRLSAGWKMQDFANGTYQSGLHAITIAYRLGILKERRMVLGLADAIIQAIPKIMHRDGSLDEAYPMERSFCVTALVAFDILHAMEILGDEISADKRRSYLDIIRPLIRHLEKHDEHHAVISNHLATAVAALVLWNQQSGENSGRHNYFLTRIYAHQSAEGWFREYEGADPGYQTLCTYYLAAANLYLQDSVLTERLHRSIEFLSHFMHPDSSIGGIYGSRNTEIFYPGGLVVLDKEIPLSRAMINHFLDCRERNAHVLPSAIDAGNFIPLLNSYAFAALHFKEGEAGIDLPWTSDFQQQYSEAGLYIHSTDKFYGIVNYKKGGTVKIYDKSTGQLDIEDGGLAGRLRNGKFFSTQTFDEKQSFTNHIINARFYAVNEAGNTPFKFLIIRLLSLTFFRSHWFGTWFKKSVVRLLMTGKSPLSGMAIRKFTFGPDKILIHENITPPGGTVEIGYGGRFRAIHMASSGYNAHQPPNRTPEHSRYLRIENDVA